MSWHESCSTYKQETLNGNNDVVDNLVGIRKMKYRNTLSSIVTTALATIVLSGAALAETESAIAVEHDLPAVNTADEVNRDRAEEATITATENAIATVLADTKLDLDIRLIGPTSTKIAGDR